MQPRPSEELNQRNASFDNRLRPTRFDDFVGQQKVRDRLLLAVEAARQRKEALDSLAAENESLRSQLVAAENNLAASQAEVAARDASLAIAASQIAELEQRIVNLNSGIDAAQGQV